MTSKNMTIFINNQIPMHIIDLTIHSYTLDRSQDEHMPFSQLVMTIGKEEC